VRRTPGRPEIAATPRSLSTPSKRSRSDTPTTTPLRWGAQQHTRLQQNIVVETSDQLSVAAVSPAVNLNPTSPLAVGEFTFCKQSPWEIARFLSHVSSCMDVCNT
jgi:hypothetical protein